MNISDILLNGLGIKPFKPKSDVNRVIDTLLHCLVAKKSYQEAMLLLIKEFNPQHFIDTKELEKLLDTFEIVKLAYSSVNTKIFLMLLPTYKLHTDTCNKVSYCDISINTILDTLGYRRDYKRSTFRGFLSRCLADINNVLPNSLLLHKYDKVTDSYRFTFITANSLEDLKGILESFGNVSLESLDKYQSLFEEKRKYGIS